MELHRAEGRGNESALGRRLRALEGAPYPAYRDLRGTHPLGPLDLEFLHIQPDPFAPASRIRVRIPLADVGIEQPGLSRPGRTATEDFLAREVEAWLRANGEVGSVVRIDPAPQQILRRSAATVDRDFLTLLLFADLPARGRRIEGRRAAAVLAEGVPRLVRETVLRGSWDPAGLARHRASAEDHAALTSLLRDRGWIAFAADGSRLARRSGEEDSPLGASCIPLEAPAGAAAEVVLPHAGTIRGLAIPEGITLLCGGGFHGKSTLLRALGRSVYPHVPGDGRERIAMEPTAMAVRAEDGRAILGVDLSPFIRGLPDGRDTRCFRTNNASGSASQAAAIIEAVEAGCRCLLIDEDTSATNFLLRDPWMARLLLADQEPIVPLLARAREMRERLDVSMLLVVGGSGEAFRIADRAILMDRYRPREATARVEELRREMEPLAAAPSTEWTKRDRAIPLDALRSTPARVRARGMRSLSVGNSECDLGASLALVSPAQANMLACILRSWLEDSRARVTLPGHAVEAAARIGEHGPLAFGSPPRGDLAEVRAQEIAMLMSRLRGAADDTDDRGRGGTGEGACG
jgi:predicted ABC-class ATPase